MCSHDMPDLSPQVCISVTNLAIGSSKPNCDGTFIHVIYNIIFSSIYIYIYIYIDVYTVCNVCYVMLCYVMLCYVMLCYVIYVIYVM